MQYPRLSPSEEIPNPKLWKKKIPSPKVSSFQLQEDEFQQMQNPKAALPVKTGRKSSKRNAKNEVSQLFQLPESSIPAHEYRVLRRKYLLLEEESFTLDRELRDVEDEVKTLEGEKHALLDQLVVLEGLIDPAELQDCTYISDNSLVKRKELSLICDRRLVVLGTVDRSTLSH